MSDRPRKAYSVTLKGTVSRDFIVWADSVAHATAIMRGDRSEAMAVADYYDERGFTRPRRLPEEDGNAP